MEDNNKIEDSYLSDSVAFKSLSDISTSYHDGLTRSILDMVETSDGSLTMENVLEKFGQYETVHAQLKKLLLDNRLVLYETAPNSIANRDFRNQQIKKVDNTLSSWIDLAAQPCLTCAYVSECAIDNPVSPASCEEFNAWLVEEVDLEYQFNTI